MNKDIVIWIVWIIFVTTGLVFSVFRPDVIIGAFLLGTATGMGVAMFITHDSRRIKI